MRLAILIPILLLGLLLRADSAWQGAESNLPDSAAYERIARGLHRDGEFVERGPGTPAHPQAASNYSPGLPLLTAGWFDLTGSESVRSARLALALISALSIPLAWMLAGRLVPPGVKMPAEIAAAAVAAFYPTVIADAGMLLTEPLVGTLVLGALLALVGDGDRPVPGRRWVLAGILLGLAAMVRPEYLLIGLLAMTALLLAPDRRQQKRSAALVLVAILAFGITVTPWLVRAGHASGRPVAVSTGGGQTLFTGSVLGSGGDPTRVMPQLLAGHPGIVRELNRENRASGEGADSITPERVFGLLARRRFPGLPTDLALARMGRENYLRSLKSDPIGLAGFLAAKSIRVWWRGRRDLTGSIGGRVVHWLITGLALAGLLSLGLRRRRELLPVLAITLGATLVGAILVASPRRALALLPLVAVLSGVGLSAALSLAAAGIGRRTAGVPVPTGIGGG